MYINGDLIRCQNLLQSDDVNKEFEHMVKVTTCELFFFVECEMVKKGFSICINNFNVLQEVKAFLYCCPFE